MKNIFFAGASQRVNEKQWKPEWFPAKTWSTNGHLTALSCCWTVLSLPFGWYWDITQCLHLVFIDGPALYRFSFHAVGPTLSPGITLFHHLVLVIEMPMSHNRTCIRNFTCTSAQLPHKALAEVSKAGHYRRSELLWVVMHGWQSESTDGPKGGWSCAFWNGCSAWSPQPQLLNVAWRSVVQNTCSCSFSCSCIVV